ncbi:hypothetical protein F4818DRAFT_441297 [Hypoxylon cercidicola]|nr:hypothetical protein F4818DRAFT_441297 [Hypoxylon cercidicola]
MPSDSANKQPHHDRQFWEQNFRKKRNFRGGPKQAPAAKVRGDPWQSLNAIQLGLEPRSFDKLHAERSYLLEMLQQHDQRAFELFQRVPIVDEQWKMAETTDEQQKARKHRGWLRHRIGDIVEEEKSILTRLSELHVEIQCRERWHQVERDREMRNLEQRHAPGYMAFPPPIIPVPYYQFYAPPPFFYSQYPPYGYAEAPNMQSGYDWGYQHPEDSQNAPEYNHEPGAFEMDGTPIDGTLNTEPRRRSASLSITPHHEPKKQTSMPSLNHTSARESNDLDNHHTSPSSSSWH